jgi:hypothetical protein
MVSGLATLLYRFLRKDDSNELCGLLVEGPRWRQKQQQGGLPRTTSHDEAARPGLGGGSRPPLDSSRHPRLASRSHAHRGKPIVSHMLIYFGGREWLVR